MSLSNLTLLLGETSLQDWLLLFILIFTRWISLISMVPFLGARLISAQIRIAIALLFSIISFYFICQEIIMPKNLSILFIFILFIKEAVLGFFLGFLISQIFFLYELAGHLMDFSRGANAINQLVPQMQTQSSILGSLLFQLSLALFLSLGLHRPVINSIFLSFENIPIFSFNINFFDNYFTSSVKILSILLKISFSLALPVISISFLLDIAFAIINRASPQINAYFLSLPVKILAGIVILFFALPLILEELANYQKIFNLALPL